jgi:hypothetical protein
MNSQAISSIVSSALTCCGTSREGDRTVAYGAGDGLYSSSGSLPVDCAGLPDQDCEYMYETISKKWNILHVCVLCIYSSATLFNPRVPEGDR